MSSSLIVLLYTYLCTLCCHSAAFEEGQAIDSAVDQDGIQWVVLSGILNEEFANKWQDDELWDNIDKNLPTNKGHFITKKCEHGEMGREICLCEFERLSGQTHRCHRTANNDDRRQQMMNHVNAAHSPLKNVASHPQSIAVKKKWTRNEYADEALEEELAEEEQEVEDEIVAAQIELQNYHQLDAGELDEIEDDLEDLIEDEEAVLIAENGGSGMSEIAYDHEIIDILDEEIETQSELIEKQNELIDELKENNAMKEAIIDIMDEDEIDNDNEDGYEDMEDEDGYQNAFDSDFDNAGLIEVDEAAYGYDSDNDNGNDNYDEMQQLQNEEAYFDGVGDEDFEFADGFLDENDEENSRKDMEYQESEAMIADTVWGLEIYSTAFAVLLCCCIGCYCYKTDCFGQLQRKNNRPYGHGPYKQNGFKTVFGNIEDDDEEDMDDVEIGKVDANDSDEAERLKD